MEVVVPNSTLSKAAIEIFTKPRPLNRRTVLIDVGVALAGQGVKEPINTRGKVAWVSSQPPWRVVVAFEAAVPDDFREACQALVGALPG